MDHISAIKKKAVQVSFLERLNRRLQISKRYLLTCQLLGHTANKF